MIARSMAMVMAMTICLSAGAQEPVRPMLTIGPVAGVTVDGSPLRDEWAAAAGASAFVRLGGTLAPYEARCSVGYDETGLVVGWSILSAPHAERRGRDGELWHDDEVELFLQPDPAGPYYQFIVSASGDVGDGQGQDRSWDANWEAAVSVAPGSWTAEMRIPFEALGVTPRPGDVWRVNFARHSTIPDEYLTWAPLQRSLHEPDHFGEMRFSAAAPECSVSGVGVFRRASGHRLLVAVGAQARQGATLTAILLAQGTEIARRVGQLQTVLELPVPEPGRYVLRMVGVGAAGAEVFRQEVPVYVKPPIELSLRKGLLEAMAVIFGIDAEAAPGVPERYRISVNGEQAATVEAHAANPRRATATVSLAGVEPGEVTLAVEAMAGERVIASEATSFELPPQPDYVGSDIGISDELPAPWTPVEADADAVRCWGREYVFDGQALPARITTADAQLLAGPIRLVAVAGRRHQLWRDTDVQWRERTRTAAHVTVTASAEGASLR